MRLFTILPLLKNFLCSPMYSSCISGQYIPSNVLFLTTRLKIKIPIIERETLSRFSFLANFNPWLLYNYNWALPTPGCPRSLLVFSLWIIASIQATLQKYKGNKFWKCNSLDRYAVVRYRVCVNVVWKVM